MGSDDENWTPKPLKPKPPKYDPNSSLIPNHPTDSNNQKFVKPFINDNHSIATGGSNSNQTSLNTNQSMKTSNTYHISLNGDKRIISAANLEDIEQNIKLKYSLANTQLVHINHWSDEYHDWVKLDAFPPDKTKLQVILMDQNYNKIDTKSYVHSIKTEQDFHAIIRSEIVKYLENPLNISKHMNHAFKYCIDANKQADVLNYYETSVHYITKRYTQNHASPTKQLLVLQEKQQQLIDKLIDEGEQLRQENRRIKQQLDDLKKDLDAALGTTSSGNKTTNNSKNKSTPTKTRCSIM